MEPARHFRDLVVWRHSHRFVLAVYTLTEKLPADERYGLCSQMRRAAVSIPANIAEGFVRFDRKDKRRFFRIAHSSAAESHYYLILCQDLGYGETQLLCKGLDSISGMLARYAAALSKAA